MQEFQKWWETSGFREKTLPFVDDEAAAYWTWKAALDWIYRKAVNIEFEEDGTGFSIVDLGNLVEKELKC